MQGSLRFLLLIESYVYASSLSRGCGSRDPALLVLPTGAGKSLVIAHVKELVEQNSEKFMSYGLEDGIYSAGLDRKDTS